MFTSTIKKKSILYNIIIFIRLSQDDVIGETKTLLIEHFVFNIFSKHFGPYDFGDKTISL